ncbi:MAG: 3'-5' exonuclease [Spirochaetaceae bacterium]|nr:MAG: 3'-5' exonuclease [Spirochaetaceae bacterium]
MDGDMSEFTYIKTDAQFGEFLERLSARGVETIAADIEGEFNLHVYGERFCLLQLYDGHEQVVVDPFTVSADSIKKLLESPDPAKVTYDSASDRLLLAKSHGITMAGIVDLRPAVELLEFPKQDLSSVIRATIGGTESGSKKKFQQYNWTRRPLDRGAIEYALQDVLHLFSVRDVLFERLRADGLMERYEEENQRRQDRLPDVNRKPGVFRTERHKRLTREQKREFERLHTIRDRHARELDLPPNTVVRNDDLFGLVTGRLAPEQIAGNRRMPEARLRSIKDQFAGRDPQ